jgi:hypothetical protein
MKKQSPTNSSLRWWFRSRESEDELSSLSYWLLAFIAGSFGFVLLSFIWPKAVTYYTDAEYKDWIASPRPRALLAAAEGDSVFRKKLDDLIAAIEHENLGQNPNQIPLAPAVLGNPCDAKISASLGITAQPDRSFGEVSVYPACVTFTKDKSKQLSKEDQEHEDAVFRNFAAYVVTEFQKQPKQDGDSSHTERPLARAMGLSDNMAGSSFDVPWIYVASHNGSIAVFPGTTVISDPSWKTSSRPWWQETFGGQLHLASDGPGQIGDRLTVTYLDVLTNTPILVRTYLRKFHSGEFVAAIDLYHRDDQPLRALSVLGVDLTKPPWQLRFGIALAASLVVFTLVRWTASAPQQKFVFELHRSVYGDVTAEKILDLLDEEATKSVTGWKLIFGREGLGTISKESEHERRDADSGNMRLSISDNVRGFEKWLVSHQSYRSWRLLWRFASVSKRRLGEVELTYGGAILPKSEWRPGSFRKDLFLKRDEKYYENRLLEVLRENADACKDRLEVPSTKEELENFATVAEIPEWVRVAIGEPQQLSAIRQRRAYLSMDDAKLGEIYDRASNVRAVILLSYFERLFHRHQADFLIKGKTITRLVCFPDETTQLNIGEGSHERYDELQSSSRTLRRVNSTIDEADSPKPPYDFAIIETGPSDDKWVIVTRSVSETRLIERESSREGPTTYRADCYISWRPSDVKFYDAKFAELNGKSIAMPPTVAQTHRQRA